ncbi:MAG: starch-binding protein, partial [Bacteroidales bacterium]|nr:starch-binding protein [Bacteroidales bacterium]
EDALGLSESLIFNNNGVGIQLADYALKFEKNEYFLTVSSEGVTPIENPTTSVVFVDDQTGWEAISLYMWGDVNDLGGGWPGVQVSGTATVNGIDTKVFVVQDAIGNAESLIFNNNGGGTQLADYALKYERNAYYLKVSDAGVNVF